MSACSVPTTRAPIVRAVRRGLVTGSPQRRIVPEEERGSPRLPGCPLRPCRSPTSRRSLFGSLMRLTTGGRFLYPGRLHPPTRPVGVLVTAPASPFTSLPAAAYASEDAAFRVLEPLSTGIRGFRDCNPAAQSLACLRINRRVTASAARLTTGLLARLWPDGACTRRTAIRNFMPSSHRHSFPTGLAWSLPRNPPRLRSIFHAKRRVKAARSRRWCPRLRRC